MACLFLICFCELDYTLSKDNFIPIWNEVKILRLITFRQVVGKIFQKLIPGRLPRIDMKFKSQLRCNLH